jgi:hypothetical protein
MEVTGQLLIPAALPPGKEPPVPFGQEAVCDPEPVWTLWRREQFCIARNRTRAIHLIACRGQTGRSLNIRCKEDTGNIMYRVIQNEWYKKKT